MTFSFNVMHVLLLQLFTCCLCLSFSFFIDFLSIEYLMSIIITELFYDSVCLVYMYGCVKLYIYEMVLISWSQHWDKLLLLLIFCLLLHNNIYLIIVKCYFINNESFIWFFSYFFILERESFVFLFFKLLIRFDAPRPNADIMALIEI